MMDFGGSVNCYYPINAATGARSAGVTNECNVFFDAFSKNLQVQKVCKGNSKSDGCVSVYQTYHTDPICIGYSQNYIDNYDYSYVLSNGQIIITFGVVTYPLFLIDINGQKGPNAYGKDLFSFMINRHEDSGLYINRGHCEFSVSGGKTTAEMMQYSLGGKR